MSKVIQFLKVWRGKWFFFPTAIIAALAAVLLGIKLLDPRREFDVVGVNVGTSDVYEAGAYLDDWYVGWGYLGRGVSMEKEDVSLYLRPPSRVKVVWTQNKKVFERQVPIEGARPFSMAERPLPAFVIEIDPECGRARAQWREQYYGSLKNRNLTHAAPDCSVYSDVAAD